MQDTISFVKSIETPNFEKAVSEFFDQHMALYNMVGSCTAIQRINGEVTDSSISFDLKFGSKKEAKSMYESLDHTIPYIYGRRFDLNKEVKDNTVTVEFM